MRESHAKCVRLGRSVGGATVVGRDPAFIQPVDPRVLYYIVVPITNPCFMLDVFFRVNTQMAANVHVCPLVGKPKVELLNYRLQ